MHATVNPFTREISLKAGNEVFTINFDYFDESNELDWWRDLTIDGKKYTVHIVYFDGFQLSMYAYNENSRDGFFPNGTVDFSTNYIVDFNLEFKIWDQEESYSISRSKSSLISKEIKK